MDNNQLGQCLHTYYVYIVLHVSYNMGDAGLIDGHMPQLLIMWTNPDDPEWLVRVVDVQVVDVSGERDREYVAALPQTAHLLVLNLVAHVELTARGKIWELSY